MHQQQSALKINWLRPDGSVMRSDATQSACGDTPGRARIRLAKPAGAQIAYFYFINDGRCERTSLR
jgi:hypothetical protein